MTALTANTSEPSGPSEFVIRRIGAVGLGHMGQAFAVNLVEDGHQVSVYDRDPKRAAAVTGARAAARLADLAACDVVVTSLPDDDALAAVALGPEGLAGVLAPNAVHISTSTVNPAMSRRVAEEHARHRQGYVAAPVLGNPDFAKARKLFVLAAGPTPELEKVRPLLERLGQRLFVIGEDAGLAKPCEARCKRPDRDNARVHGRGVGPHAKRRRRRPPRVRCADKFTVRFPDPQELRREDCRRSLQSARNDGAARRQGSPARAGRSRTRGRPDARREPRPRSLGRNGGSRVG